MSRFAVHSLPAVLLWLLCGILNAVLAAPSITVSSTIPISQDALISFQITGLAPLTEVTLTLSYFTATEGPSLGQFTADESGIISDSSSLEMMNLPPGIYYINGLLGDSQQRIYSANFGVQGIVVVTSDDTSTVLQLSNFPPAANTSYQAFASDSGVAIAGAAGYISTVETIMGLPLYLPSGSYFVQVISAGVASKSNNFVVGATQDPFIVLHNYQPIGAGDALSFQIYRVGPAETVTASLIDSNGNTLPESTVSYAGSAGGNISASIPISPAAPVANYNLTARVSDRVSNTVAIQIRPGITITLNGTDKLTQEGIHFQVSRAQPLARIEYMLMRTDLLKIPLSPNSTNADPSGVATVNLTLPETTPLDAGSYLLSAQSEFGGTFYYSNTITLFAAQGIRYNRDGREYDTMILTPFNSTVYRPLPGSPSIESTTVYAFSNLTNALAVPPYPAQIAGGTGLLTLRAGSLYTVGEYYFYVTFNNVPTNTLSFTVIAALRITSDAPYIRGQPVTATLYGYSAGQTVNYALYSIDRGLVIGTSDVKSSDPVNTQLFPILPEDLPPGRYFVRATVDGVNTDSGTFFPTGANFTLVLTSDPPYLPGSTISFNLTGILQPFDNVMYGLYSASTQASVVTGDAQTDENGFAPVSFTIPLDTAPGSYYVQGIGPDGQTASNEVNITLNSPFTIDITTPGPYHANMTIEFAVIAAPALTNLPYALYFSDTGSEIAPRDMRLRRRADILVPGTSGSKDSDEQGNMSAALLIPPGSLIGEYFVRISLNDLNTDSPQILLEVSEPVVTITSTGPYTSGTTITFTVSGAQQSETIEYGIFNADGSELDGTDASQRAGLDGTITVTITIPQVDVGTYSVRASIDGRPSNIAEFEVAVGPSAANGRARRRQLQRRKQKVDCPHAGETACYSIGDNFECVNLEQDLEHCGGCNMAGMQQYGQNCLDIPYALGVSCKQGRCHVSSCEGLKEPNANASACN